MFDVFVFSFMYLWLKAHHLPAAGCMAIACSGAGAGGEDPAFPGLRARSGQRRGTDPPPPSLGLGFSPSCLPREGEGKEGRGRHL